MQNVGSQNRVLQADPHPGLYNAGSKPRAYHPNRQVSPLGLQDKADIGRQQVCEIILRPLGANLTPDTLNIDLYSSSLPTDQFKLRVRSVLPSSKPSVLDR
jgi:hypothetical protein